MPMLEVRGLVKTYLMAPEHAGRPPRRVEVLRGVDLDILPGEMVALTGPSGSGKSTFLNVLGALDVPTAGEVRFEGEAIFGRDEAGLAAFRNEAVGFIFQSHHLLPEFTALENATMPALIRRAPRAEARRAALEMLDLVGLGDRTDHRPGELSGGEQQRVALARALCLKPRLLLADEPTGNLDPATAEGIHRLLADLNARLGITMVIVTHNEQLADALPRRLRLSAGRIVQGPAAAPAV
ncbi:ABC transporter ATP-binding protein [Anaeromyxobacter diazotrophicus]|uniref:Lipoprotein-releasing system ATP-binding protein LolD n=1 Tax=Anaeromyxobacter diazotrophicus TaxID=2590199 RepID=A0A7I9VQV7_9BACT|nr:ABC transporter ATP-binding protein [Anaeromyxobacter diazotrophicus]GEJ58741.1 lipoprotein-releasing system ATP-binding protein LolD [Anaeromyxobacter diazotrophicus]